MLAGALEDKADLTWLDHLLTTALALRVGRCEKAVGRNGGW